MTQPLKLYDLTRRNPSEGSWSYNVWKTRLALNYKGISYTTAWVNHNTLSPTLKGLGVPPNTGPGFEYTVPTVQFPNDNDGSEKIVTDSAAIARELEARYPDTKSLHLNPTLEARAEKIVHMTAGPLFAIYMPLVSRSVVVEDTVSTFKSSRERRFGMSLDEMERVNGGEVAWGKAESGFVELKRLLTEFKTGGSADDHEDEEEGKGPFIHGAKVCYADFIIVALFEAFRRVDEGMFERAVGWDRVFRELYDASREWIEKNDH